MSDDLLPLTPLAEMALHDAGKKGMPRDAWWACSKPEVPMARTLYDWRCPKCVMHAQAVIHNGDDPEMWWRSKPGEDGGVVKLSWLVERALAWQAATI